MIKSNCFLPQCHTSWSTETPFKIDKPCWRNFNLKRERRLWTSKWICFSLLIKQPSTQTFSEHRDTDSHCRRGNEGSWHKALGIHYTFLDEWKYKSSYFSYHSSCHTLVVVCCNSANKRSRDPNSHTAGEPTWDPDTRQVYSSPGFVVCRLRVRPEPNGSSFMYQV